jgi:hypothetical protein
MTATGHNLLRSRAKREGTDWISSWGMRITAFCPRPWFGPKSAGRLSWPGSKRCPISSSPRRAAVSQRLSIKQLWTNCIVLKLAVLDATHRNTTTFVIGRNRIPPSSPIPPSRSAALGMAKEIRGPPSGGPCGLSRTPSRTRAMPRRSLCRIPDASRCQRRASPL